LGHLGSKTRSLGQKLGQIIEKPCIDNRGRSFHPGQIIEKPCVDNRGHSFHPIFMKFGQNVYLDKIWIGIVFGSSGVRN